MDLFTDRFYGQDAAVGSVLLSVGLFVSRLASELVVN